MSNVSCQVLTWWAMCFPFSGYVQVHCTSALYRYDTCGRTPLHVAASCGKVDTLNWLINCYTDYKAFSDISIDSQDKESGWTALHRAAYYGRIPCIAALLQVLSYICIICHYSNAMDRAATSWYFLEENGCNLMFYLTSKHVFKNFGGGEVLPGFSSWLQVWLSYKQIFMKTHCSNVCRIHANHSTMRVEVP